MPVSSIILIGEFQNEMNGHSVHSPHELLKRRGPLRAVGLPVLVSSLSR